MSDLRTAEPATLPEALSLFNDLADALQRIGAASNDSWAVEKGIEQAADITVQLVKRISLFYTTVTNSELFHLGEQVMDLHRVAKEWEAAGQQAGREADEAARLSVLMNGSSEHDLRRWTLVERSNINRVHAAVLQKALEVKK